MEHKLPDLPYAKNALAPHISEETLQYHYGKHLRAYVEKLNELLKGTRHEKQPLAEIAKLIQTQWGSFEKFQAEFSATAKDEFGSGWTWLMLDPAGKLEIINTHDAVTPMTVGMKGILTLDVWEHAHYIDYRNERPKFVEAFWNLVNWDFANSNL